MKSVSILLPLHNNYLISRTAIEYCIEHTGVSNCEIIAYNNGSTDPAIKEWLTELPNTIYLESPNQCVVRNSVAINEMLKVASKEYICIIPSPVFLPENWLCEMLKSNLSVLGSGITAINPTDLKGNLTNKLTEEYQNVFVYQPSNNVVSGVFLFCKSIVNEIGGFDPELNQGYEFFQYCYRVGMLGLSNYYVPGLNAVELADLEPTCFYTTSQEDFIKNLAKVKKGNLKIKFQTSSPKMFEAYKDLEQLINKFATSKKKSWYLELSDMWGFDISAISDYEINYITSFCEKWNLSWCILHPQEFHKGLSINFFENESNS